MKKYEQIALSLKINESNFLKQSINIIYEKAKSLVDVLKDKTFPQEKIDITKGKLFDLAATFAYIGSDLDNFEKIKKNLTDEGMSRDKAEGRILGAVSWYYLINKMLKEEEENEDDFWKMHYKSSAGLLDKDDMLYLVNEI